MSAVKQRGSVEAKIATRQRHRTRTEGGDGIGLQTTENPCPGVANCTRGFKDSAPAHHRATCVGAVSAQSENAIPRFGEGNGAETIIDGAAEHRVHSKAVLRGEVDGSSDPAGDRAIAD